jgi:hypothetical protein
LKIARRALLFVPATTGGWHDFHSYSVLVSPPTNVLVWNDLAGETGNKQSNLFKRPLADAILPKHAVHTLLSNSLTNAMLRQ